MPRQRKNERRSPFLFSVGDSFKLSVVVKATGKDSDFVVEDFVNKAVFLVNATRPTTCKFMFEGFGLACTSERISLNFLDKLDDFAGFLTIFIDPLG
ncbi:hypothetical protein AWQ21_13270 [Picosynechococcus sp. PCC 7003]|nr:hypothetical protein AWQ21_13270 [Picosynechococcus sp. PCC 7003]